MLISLGSILKGLNNLDINKKSINKDLNENHIVISEGIVNRLKVVSNTNLYDLFKDIAKQDCSRGYR